jgi:hypothetical protein
VVFDASGAITVNFLYFSPGDKNRIRDDKKR